MKTDLATSIGAAVIGVLIAFFVTNQFIGPIEEVTFKTINGTVNTTLMDPDPEVFNYRALNPTVEVYVGDCDEYDEFGECIEVVDSSEVEEVVEETIKEETKEESTEEKPAEEESTETNQDQGNQENS